MKLHYNGRLTAIAETEQDVIELVSMYGKGTVVHAITPKKRNVPKNYRKPCIVCGEKYMLGLGMATHLRLKHADIINEQNDETTSHENL